ncbi:MAG: hypothetical protein ACM3SO_18105, partial [Betaproteobacteria bacterium]
MQKDTTAPDARLAAVAKVAYATLSDPDARAEYDESLGAAPVRFGRTRIVAASVAALIVGAGVAYYFFARFAGTAPGAPAFDMPRLLEQVGSRIGHLQAAEVSGQVRELGLAVETGDDEMLTTCRGIEAGASLTVVEGKASLRAEVAGTDPAGELCRLSVKGARAAVKLRGGVPSSQEQLQAIVIANGVAQARAVNVGRRVTSAQGQAFTIKPATALPNGTPLFDSREQLVGLVIAPHEYGEGRVVALSASRMETSREGASPPAAAAAAAAATPRTRETMVAQGFTTLWKEENNERLGEVLDDVGTGKVGLPVAHWTRWKGVDGAQHSNHCTVTFGQEEDLVADYEQYPSRQGDEMYRFCALTRLQVDLDDLPVGEYHFTTVVDGKPVAQASIRLERRLVTPARLAVLVIVAGLALLAWVRRRRARA